MECISKHLIISFILLALLLNIIVVCGERRDISFEINPQCGEQNITTLNCSVPIECTDPWLVYGKGVTSMNSVHYFWGFKELPTFVMMTADKESNIDIDWCLLQQHKPGAIVLTKNPHNIFGLSFQNLILYDDQKDSGHFDINANDSTLNTSLSDFKWRIVDLTHDDHSWTSSFETYEFQNETLDNDTKISFSITSYETNDRSSVVPHLITTPASSQINIVLDNLLLKFNNQTLNGYEHPRWALDTLVVSYEAKDNDGFRYTSHKSLDDEYTPGVFDLVSVTTLKARLTNSTSDHGGYMQWRPVCYLDKDDNINYATYPNVQIEDDSYLPQADDEHIMNATQSLLYSMFGNHAVNMGNKAQTIISFGLTADGYYTKYNYMKWTIAIGLGAVPEEKFSSLVIIVICVGVGIPLGIFVLSIVYFGIKKN